VGSPQSAYFKLASVCCTRNSDVRMCARHICPDSSRSHRSKQPCFAQLGMDSCRLCSHARVDFKNNSLLVIVMVFRSTANKINTTERNVESGHCYCLDLVGGCGNEPSSARQPSEIGCCQCCKLHQRHCRSSRQHDSYSWNRQLQWKCEMIRDCTSSFFADTIPMDCTLLRC
jgi:hypothetical protein